MLITSGVKVYIARGACDLRKAYNGLSLLVQDVLNLDPLSGHFFVFFNRLRDKVKILYWDRNGFCLWQKRLEKEKFKVPSFYEAYWQMTFQEFHLLLEGIDVRTLPPQQGFEKKRMG